jgi:hypothetical protein
MSFSKKQVLVPKVAGKEDLLFAMQNACTRVQHFDPGKKKELSISSQWQTPL